MCKRPLNPDVLKLDQRQNALGVFVTFWKKLFFIKYFFLTCQTEVKGYLEMAY